jgi:hypothetical protein
MSPAEKDSPLWVPSPPSADPERLSTPNDTTSLSNKDVEDDQDDFPEGGTQAWLVAAGSAGAFFCTLGYTNVFGIFQAYYMFNQMPEQSADNIAWIGSVQAFLIFAAGAVGGPLFDRFGARVSLHSGVGGSED